MKFFILAAVLAVAIADSTYDRPTYDRPTYDRPAYKAAPAYKPDYKPDYKPSYSAPSYDEPRRPHDFAYEVKDDYTYVNMGQKESSDGKGVSGSYHVTLPDGRVQTVNYKDDGYGLVADVSAPESGYKSYEPKSYSAPSYERPSYERPAYPAREY